MLITLYCNRQQIAILIATANYADEFLYCRGIHPLKGQDADFSLFGLAWDLHIFC